METVLELEDVTHRFGKVTALDGLSLQIRAGEVVAILGPNGAGKTTAINLLLGLLEPQSGTVSVFGGRPQKARSRLGTMMQATGIPETLTVREHLELFASYYPSPLAVGATLQATGLTEVQDRLYGKLSGGQKQRLHLALALAGNPDVLFLDEPTTGLDVTTRRALWALVRDFISTGRTVVLTTHYLEEADALADRVIVLNRGKVVAEGTPDAIRERTAGRRLTAVTPFPVEQAQNLPGVARASREGDTLELLLTRAEPATRALLDADPGLSGLNITTVGLDEAFISLTSQNGASV